MALLVRTPTPFPTESLFSFVLRVAECNGYETPRDMLLEEGFTRGQIVAAGFPIKLFADMLGQDPALLSSMAYCKDAAGIRTYKILDHEFGQSLIKGELRLAQPAFCPQCLQENGFVETFWDLTAAVACPTHRTWAIERCHACDNPLKWFRRKLLSCDCGASFSEAQLDIADTTTIELMAVLKAKLYRRPISSLDNTSNFPISLLDQLPLTVLLEALMHFGSSDSLTERASAVLTSPYRNVSSVIAEWPTGYHKFLRKIGDGFLAQGEKATGLRKQFEPFYKAMFVNSPHAAHFTTFQQEFLNFGLHHWGKATIDERLLRRMSMKHSQRFYSKSALASTYGISKPTMKRLLADGALVSKTINTESRTRTFIDLEKSTLPMVADDHICVRQAAKYLGLPVAVLKHLRASRVYAQRPRRGHGSSWFMDDLQDFLNRGLSLAPKTLRAPDGVALQQAMRFKFRDAGAKATIVAAALDGRIKILGRAGDNLGGLILDRAGLEKIVSDLRADTVRHSYLPKDVTKITGLYPTAINGAISLGLLSATYSRGRQRIPASLLDRFNAEYVTISRIAGTFGTNSRRLLRMCREAVIPVINVPCMKGAAQPIVRRADQIALERLWLKETSKPVSKVDREADCAAVLRSYLERLQTNGEELPLRGEKPNICAIARACGFSRHVLYAYKPVMSLLMPFNAPRCAQG